MAAAQSIRYRLIAAGLAEAECPAAQRPLDRRTTFERESESEKIFSKKGQKHF